MVPEPSSASVKSAIRTLDVLEFLVAQRQPMAARDLSIALAIPVSSLSYLLTTLVDRGYLARDGRHYAPGPALPEAVQVPHLDSGPATHCARRPRARLRPRGRGDEHGHRAPEERPWPRTARPSPAARAAEPAGRARQAAGAGAPVRR